jgi:hypothetical protein
MIAEEDPLKNAFSRMISEDSLISEHRSLNGTKTRVAHIDEATD